MSGGRYRRKKPSGCQQRKAKKARMTFLKKIAGSMLPYVRILDDAGTVTSNNTAHQSPNYKADSSSDATLNSVEEQGVAMKIIKEEQEVAITVIKEEQESGAEEHVDCDCSQDAVNGRSAIRENDL